MMDPLFFLHTKDIDIFTQLQIEEALVKTDTRSFCWINEGTKDAIVMGISAKQEDVICPHAIQKAPVPVIKRFSGGGSVLVDQDTIFITFILNHKTAGIKGSSDSILSWAASFYTSAIDDPSFQYREQDFVLGEQKCGGNAQYIRKDRFLFHSSFLWDFSEEKMQHLLFPKKTPPYRNNRSHAEFLKPLSAHFSCKDSWINLIKQAAEKQFLVKNISLEYISKALERPHRRATKKIPLLGS